MNILLTQSWKNWIRSIFIYGIILSAGILNNSCSEDDSDSDAYYVKYEVDSSTIYTGKLNVRLTDENNEPLSLQIPAKIPWEVVIGPVKKGFYASLQVSEANTNYGHLSLYLKISVCKNEEPFALKAMDGSDENRTTASLNYTIE